MPIPLEKNLESGLGHRCDDDLIHNLDPVVSHRHPHRLIGVKTGVFSEGFPFHAGRLRIFSLTINVVKPDSHLLSMAFDVEKRGFFLELRYLKQVP